MFPFKYLDTIRALGEKKKMATVTVDRSYRHSFYSFFLDSTFYRQDTHRTDCVTICVGSTPFLFSSTLTPHLFFVCEADELFLFPSTIQLILLGGIASLPTTVFVRPPFYIPLLHPLLPSYLFFFFGYFSPPPPPPFRLLSSIFSIFNHTHTRTHSERKTVAQRQSSYGRVVDSRSLTGIGTVHTPLCWIDSAHVQHYLH